jgi:SAM-dependent methyltransferase
MSEWYQAKHGPQLNTRSLAWGVWAIPEAEIGALGTVSGKVILELGCGGGQWSMFLAEAGARPVGFDLSEQQLDAARRLMRTPYPLIHGDAERLPLRDACIDVVLSDHGAMTWSESLHDCSRSRTSAAGGRPLGVQYGHPLGAGLPVGG